MALNKQPVAIPIDNGLETKIDAKQEELGYFRKVENVVFETIKQLRKRNGYDRLNLIDQDGATITDAKKLAKLKNELVLLADSGLYSFSDNLQNFTKRGQLFNVATEEDVVFRNSSSQTDNDGLAVDGVRVYCWADADGSVRYSVQDLDNDNLIVSAGLVAAAGEHPVVAHIGSTVFIIYGNSADVNLRSFSTTQPAVLTPVQTIISNRDTSNGLIDCESCGTKVIVAYNSSVVGAKLSLFSLDATGTPSSILGVTGQSATHALDVTCDSNFRVIVTYSDGSTIKCTIYSLTLITTPILAATTIETLADVTTCCAVELSSGQYRIYYEKDQAGTGNNYVKQANLSLAGAVSGVQVFARGVGLAARAFVRSGTPFIPVVLESNLQSTYFILREDGAIVTKFANQNAAGVIDFGVLPQFSNYAENKYFASFLLRNRLLSDNGTFFSTTGVASVLLDFAPAVNFSNAQLSNGLHIASGVLRLYDGSTVTEHGFNSFPEVLTNPSNSNTGGALTNGNRAYVAVYRWTDNSGQDHRSAPTAEPLTVTLTGGTSTHSTTISVPTLRLTNKENVVIEIYRTEDAGTTYYLVTNPLAPLANNKAVDAVTFVDTLSDAALISRELLYTTGGVLENIAAPAPDRIAVMNSNRIALFAKNSNRVIFSKETGEGRPVEFTEGIYREVDPVSGPLSSMESMRDKLVLFTQDACFYITGDGPTNTGQQDTFTLPEVVSTDVGCLDPDSVILTPAGLMFKSRKGIWILGSGLNLEYVGSRAEAYNAQTVTSAQIVGELNQVRFLLANDRALVYNYNQNKWATFENHGGISCLTLGNDFYYIREDGVLYKENRESFADDASPIKMRLETGWMNVGDIQSFQRIYHVLVLASYFSPHKLRIKVAFDFVEAWTQEEIIDPADFVNTSKYGDSATYGAESPYGGIGTQYQFRLNFARQKCQSMKLSIEDVQSEPGEGLRLSSLTFLIGAKQGTNKLPAAQKFSTE